MSDRAYDRLANALMLAAIASALVFDAGFLPHIIVGTIGGVAALASAYLYFSNQHRNRTVKADQPSCTEPVREKQAADMMTAGTSFIAPQAARDAAVRDAAARWVVMLAKREKQYVHASYIAHHGFINVKVSDKVFYGGAIVHQDVGEGNTVLSPNDVAACAIEIIQQLSKKDGDDRWEFHFGANGLRVSAKKGHATPERINVQSDFDFPPMSTTIQ